MTGARPLYNLMLKLAAASRELGLERMRLTETLRVVDEAYAELQMHVVDETEAEGGSRVVSRAVTYRAPGTQTTTGKATVVPTETTTVPKRTCSNCHKPGHRATTCDTIKPVTPLGKRACSVCRKTGHKAPTCPNREDA